MLDRRMVDAIRSRYGFGRGVLLHAVRRNYRTAPGTVVAGTAMALADDAQPRDAG